jgi:hypothetical protein
MRTDWFNREAEPMETPALSTPAAVPTQRPLEDIQKERETQPPAIPNPTGKPEPAEPMSLKELSQLMEGAAKSLFDAKLTVEKAHTALSKVGPMSSPSSMDKEIAEKSQGFAAAAKKMGDSIETLAREVSAYREELAKPRSPWLE